MFFLALQCVAFFLVPCLAMVKVRLFCVLLAWAFASFRGLMAARHWAWRRHAVARWEGPWASHGAIRRYEKEVAVMKVKATGREFLCPNEGADQSRIAREAYGLGRSVERVGSKDQESQSANACRRCARPLRPNRNPAPRKAKPARTEEDRPRLRRWAAFCGLRRWAWRRSCRLKR